MSLTTLHLGGGGSHHTALLSGFLTHGSKGAASALGQLPILLPWSFSLPALASAAFSGSDLGPRFLLYGLELPRRLCVEDSADSVRTPMLWRTVAVQIKSQNCLGLSLVPLLALFACLCVI